MPSTSIPSICAAPQIAIQSSQRQATLPRKLQIDGIVKRQRKPFGQSQGAKTPDQAARAYLRAIAGDPIGVQRALHARVWQTRRSA